MLSARTCVSAIVLAALLNAVLRPSVDIAVTPYYLAVPFLALFLLLRYRTMCNWAAGFALASVYGLTVGTLYGVPVVMQLMQLLKYFQLLTFFALLHWHVSNDADGHARLLKLAWIFGVTLFIIAGVQQLTGLQFPTVINEESHIWLNTVFFTPNDLALPLCGLLILALCSRVAWPLKLLVFGLVMLVNLRNDAKAALLACVVIVFFHLLIRCCRAVSLRPATGLLFLLLASVLTLSAARFGDPDSFSIWETEIDFLQLFADPIERILTLQPYDLGGSIFDRTDALIHNLTAFKSMYGAGLGPAGSVFTLSQEKYELLTAKSLHNAIAEFALEWGPVAMALALAWVVPTIGSLFRIRLSSVEHGRLLLLVASPLLAVSQSSGFISNYAFWLIAFLIATRPVRDLDLAASQQPRLASAHPGTGHTVAPT